MKSCDAVNEGCAPLAEDAVAADDGDEDEDDGEDEAEDEEGAEAEVEDGKIVCCKTLSDRKSTCVASRSTALACKYTNRRFMKNTKTTREQNTNSLTESLPLPLPNIYTRTSTNLCVQLLICECTC
jgi:hypothetical protein